MFFCTICGKVFLVFLFVMFIVYFCGYFINKSEKSDKKVNNWIFELTLPRIVHSCVLCMRGWLV
jgi:hypothetical protein